MSSTLVGIVMVAALVGWHLHTRRHSNWSVCPDGRFFISLGYPAVAIAMYWMLDAPTHTGLEWLLGNLWALAAMICFVHGFNALNAAWDRPPSEAPIRSGL
jgi:hypothetical protein